MLAADAVGELFEFFGFKPIVGKVWALIMMSKEPIDASRVQEILCVSSGTVSMAIQELLSLGVVRRETESGQRRFYYRAEMDMWTVAVKIYREKERGRMSTVLRKLEDSERAFNEEQASLETDEVRHFQLSQVSRLITIGRSVIGLLDAVMERTKVEVIALQKWLSVSEKLGGEPLSRIRRAINASRMDKRRQ